MKVKLLQVGPLGTNCYILEDEETREAAVIDPGGDAPAIEKALEGAELRYILLTHGHYDHTGGAAELAEAFPAAEVYVHPKDCPGPDRYLFPLETQVPGVRFYGEGDEIALGSAKVEVLHTPGHSEGSVTLLCGDAMFAGDTLFAGSCGRCDMEGGDVRQMAASLKRLGLLEGDYTVYPGHGDASTLSEERRSNHYMRQAMRL